MECNLRARRSPRNKSVQFAPESDFEDSPLPVKAVSEHKKKNKRMIRRLSRYDNLNRSSLTNEAFGQQAVIKMKKTSKKLKNLDFLPKIDIGENSKENRSPNKHRPEIVDDQKMSAKHKSESKKKTPKKSNDDETNCNKSYLSNFIITNVSNNSALNVPSTSGCKESPDEVVFKPRLKKEKPPVSVACDISLNKANDFQPSPLKMSTKKTNKKISFQTTSPVKKHSCLSKSTIQHREIQADESLNPQDNQTFRKSVRFTTPPQKEKKRDTFELQNSTFDLEDLPDANETRTKKRVYENSPHVNKLKNFVEPEDSLIEFEKLEAGMFNESVVIAKKAPGRTSRTVEVVQPKRSSVYNTPSSKKIIHYSQSIIDLVTPTLAKEDTFIFDGNDSNNTSYVVRRSSPRKRWSKPVEPSFLESFQYLQNTSVPWGTDRISSPLAEATFATKPVSDTPKHIVKTKTPVSTSTPVLLKTTLLRDKPKILIKDTKNTGSKSITKKMPNFALIHQKAYEKMENIKEMSERKAARAQQLISGQKPGCPPVTRVNSPKIRKMLNYTPKKALSPIPKVTTGDIPGKFTLNVVTTVQVIKPSTSNPKVSKPVQKKIESAKMQSRIPKPFKPKVLNKEKEDQRKAVANKVRVGKNPVEKARNTVKEVRTNRRFELLMKMRQQQKK